MSSAVAFESKATMADSSGSLPLPQAASTAQAMRLDANAMTRRCSLTSIVVRATVIMKGPLSGCWW
jgi:hypothetical protein